jgi:uncharacterized coiled-coil DUF342 family protein
MSEKTDELKSELEDLKEQTEKLISRLNDLYSDYEEIRDAEDEIDNDDIEEKIEKIEETIEIIKDEQTRELLQKQIDELRLSLSGAEFLQIDIEEIETLFDEIRDILGQTEF